MFDELKRQIKTPYFIDYVEHCQGYDANYQRVWN